MSKFSTIKYRIKYYGISFLIGYIILFFGYPSSVDIWRKINPLKLFPFIFSLYVGSLLYYVAEEKANMVEATFRGLKYVVICIVILFITTVLISMYDLDSQTIIGF